MSPRTHVVSGAVLLLGGTILAFAVHFGAPAREVIVIDSGLAARALAWEQDLRGRSLTDAERDGLIGELVDEEILLAEARRRGHLLAGSVSRRLQKKMRFLFTEELTVPSDAEMRAVYDADPAPFRRPGAIAFDQVFFRTDSPEEPEEPPSFLRRLEAAEGDGPPGDSHPLGARVGLKTDVELARLLGPAFVEALFAAPLETWTGPLSSPMGTHYVRVTTWSDPAAMPFEDVLPGLRGAWVMERQREAIARRTAELVSRYRIEVEEAE